MSQREALYRSDRTNGEDLEEMGSQSCSTPRDLISGTRDGRPWGEHEKGHVQKEPSSLASHARIRIANRPHTSYKDARATDATGILPIRRRLASQGTLPRAKH